MRIWKLYPFEHPLHTAIFTPTPMQRVKHHIGIGKSQLIYEVRASVDFDNEIARLPQSGGAFLACRQRHSTLRAGSTHQYSHSFGSPARHTHCSHSIFCPLWGFCYRVFYAIGRTRDLRPSLLPTLTSNHSYRKPFFAPIRPKLQDLLRSLIRC